MKFVSLVRVTSTVGFQPGNMQRNRKMHSLLNSCLFLTFSLSPSPYWMQTYAALSSHNTPCNMSHGSPGHQTSETHALNAREPCKQRTSTHFNRSFSSIFIRQWLDSHFAQTVPAHGVTLRYACRLQRVHSTTDIPLPPSLCAHILFSAAVCPRCMGEHISKWMPCHWF